MSLGLWVWLEMEIEMVGFGWRGLGFSRFGRGGWRSVVGVVIFVGEGWVFLSLIGVEIGGRFCLV